MYDIRPMIKHLIGFRFFGGKIDFRNTNLFNQISNHDLGMHKYHYYLVDISRKSIIGESRRRANLLGQFDLIQNLQKISRLLFDVF